MKEGTEEGREEAQVSLHTESPAAPESKHI